ncbi:MAG TPA: efflux RND transporter periplasmic adaptor subunit, partial [Candidatus Binatia bacterium]
LARIVAPVSGVVTGALTSGVFVNEARPIITIAQVDALKLTGAVPARYAGRVHEGMGAQVSPRQGMAKPRAGKVFRLDSISKAGGADIEIEIRIENRDRALQIGAAVDATLNLERQEHKLTIPRSALQSTGDQHYAFQVVDGRALRRVVEVEDASTDPVVIRHGLKAGDQIIVDRLGEITEGLRVHRAAQIQSP